MCIYTDLMLLCVMLSLLAVTCVIILSWRVLLLIQVRHSVTSARQLLQAKVYSINNMPKTSVNIQLCIVVSTKQEYLQILLLSFNTYSRFSVGKRPNKQVCSCWIYLYFHLSFHRLECTALLRSWIQNHWSSSAKCAFYFRLLLSALHIKT